jgi:hypothetical protein
MRCARKTLSGPTRRLPLISRPIQKTKQNKTKQTKAKILKQEKGKIVPLTLVYRPSFVLGRPTTVCVDTSVQGQASTSERPFIQSLRPFSVENDYDKHVDVRWKYPPHKWDQDMTSGSFVYFLPRIDPWVIGNPRPAKHDRHFYYERAIRKREGGGGGLSAGTP